MTSTTPRTGAENTMFFGLILIALGTLLLLDHLDVVGFGRMVRDYWPLILVFIGVPQLLDRRSFSTGVWMVALGGWLQASRLHLFGLTFGNSWPLLVVAAGASITVSALIDAMKKDHTNGPSTAQ